MARLWTLLILIGCLAPSVEIPRVDIPLIDKWTHVVLFGIFSFLWLCAKPALTTRWVVTLLFVSVAFGTAVELMQGTLTFLGRSAEFMDAVADGLGGIVGIAVFGLFAYFAKRTQTL